MCLIFMVCIHMSYSLAYHLAHYQYHGVDKITDYDFLVVITLAKKTKKQSEDDTCKALVTQADCRSC